uniref:USP domain-containing protein n=1 Tax=Hanusia phi TaxID=3032 RepID=A0A7S0HZK6_9CRYP
MQNLLDSSGDPVQVGNQQDVSEFNHIFLQRVEEGLNFASNGQATENNTIFKGIFEGKMLQEVLTKDDKAADSKENVISSSSCEFHELILDISRGDLHGALEDYVEAQVDDYHGESSQGNQKIVKNVWIEKFPPVLTFQLQRVSYDKDIQAPVKVNDRFTFPNELFMDRYLLAHKMKLMPRRVRRNDLRQSFDHLNQKLQHVLHFTSEGLERKDVSADEYLRGAMAFVKERSEGRGLGKVDVVVDMLNSLATQVRQETQQLQSQLRDIQKQIDLLFAEFNSDRYSLFAVLVHDGLAGSGHYWVYIKRQEGWMKYSDAEVTSVEEKEVWEMSEGGQKNASAYCLMYRRDKEDDMFAIHIPELLRSEVEEDNRRLKEEIGNWDRRSAIMKFETSLNDKMQELKDINRDALKDRDTTSWYSFEAFLERGQKPDLCKHVVGVHILPQVFGPKGLEDNETRTMFESKFQSILALNPTDLTDLGSARQLYCAFLSIASAISEADKCISMLDMDNCLLLLCGAYELQHSLELELEQAASFDAEVLDRIAAVQMLFLRRLEELVGSPEQSQSQSCLFLLLALTFKVLHFNAGDVKWQGINDSWVRWKGCATRVQESTGAMDIDSLLRGAADGWKDVAFPEYRLSRVSWDEAPNVLQSLRETRRSLCQLSNDRLEYPPVSVLYRSSSRSRQLDGDLMEVEPP